MDDGSSGFVEVDAAQINNKPYLNHHTVTGLTLLGSNYLFKVEILNEIGSVQSMSAPILLSDVPDKPSTIPVQDFTYTSEDQIRVMWDLFTTAQNGGAPVDGYDLWRDDGDSGDYTRLYEVDTVIASSFTDITAQKSTTYRYIYRARNFNGWGEFSDPGYLFAASLPQKPVDIDRLSFSKTHFKIQIYAPQETGGDDIIEYELYIDQGVENSVFRKVDSYDGQSLIFTVDATAESLTTGLIYSLKYRSLNRVGFSDYSDVLRVALADRVQAPTNLNFDVQLAASTSLELHWDEVPDSLIVTQGYYLEQL
jgi:hypothetical protein